MVNYIFEKLLCKLKSGVSKTIMGAANAMKTKSFHASNGPIEMIKLGALNILFDILIKHIPVSEEDAMSMDECLQKYPVLLNQEKLEVVVISKDECAQKYPVVPNSQQKPEMVVISADECAQKCPVVPIRQEKPEVVVILSVISDWCIHHEQARKMCQEKRNLDVIVKLLAVDNHHSLNDRAARVIANLMYPKPEDTVLSSLSQSPLLPTLVTLLGEEKVKHNRHIYCKVVRQLCHCESLREQLTEVGGVLTLCKLLLADDEDTALITRILHILCAVQCSVEFSSQVAKSGAIKQLVPWSRSDDKDRSDTSLTLLLNLTAHQDSRVAIGNADGIACLMDILNGDNRHDFSCYKVMNGVCFLCREAVSRIRLQSCGFLTKSMNYLSEERYEIMHRRLISSLTWFLYDDTSVNELSCNRFVTVLLSHLQRACHFSTTVLHQLEPSQLILDIFTSKGKLDLDEHIVNDKVKRCRSSDSEDSEELHKPKFCKQSSCNKLESIETAFSTVQSYINCDNSEDYPGTPTSADSQMTDKERSILRVNSPTYLAEVEKNRDFDYKVHDECSDKYGPLTNTHLMSPERLSNVSLPRFHHSPCRTYGPVASPLCSRSSYSPVSFQSSVNDEYSSEEEDEEVVRLHNNNSQTEQVERLNNVQNVNDKDAYVLHYIQACQQNDINVTDVKVETQTECTTLVDGSENVINSSKLDKYDENDKSRYNVKDTKTEDDKSRNNVKDTKTENDKSRNNVKDTKTEDDKSRNNVKDTKTGDDKSRNNLKDTKTESNIISILAAISYNTNNTCLVTSEHMSCMIDYLTKSKSFEPKLVRVLEKLMTDRLLFENLTTIETSRLVVSRMLQYHYTKRKPKRTESIPHSDILPFPDDPQSSTIDTSTTSYADWYTETLVDKDIQIAGGRLLEALSSLEWFHVGSVDRLLAVSDTAAQIRIAVSLLYTCSCAAIITRLLIKTGLLYALLSTLLYNNDDDTTREIIGGLHFLYKSIITNTGDMDELQPQSSKEEQVIVKQYRNDVTCVYETLVHDVSFTLNGQTFHGQRAQMCDSSEVFAAMLSGDFKESREDTVQISPLSHTSSDAFLFMLHHVHGCSVHCPVISSTLILPKANSDPKVNFRTFLGIQQLGDYFKICDMTVYAGLDDYLALGTVCDVYEYAVLQSDDRSALRSLQFLLMCPGENSERLNALLDLTANYGRVVIDTIFNDIQRRVRDSS